MRADQSAEWSGNGEGHEVIRDRQKPSALTSQPFGGIGVAALRAGAVIARVINKVLPPAFAPEDLTSKRGRAATENGSDGAPVRRQQARAKLPFIRRPVAA